MEKNGHFYEAYETGKMYLLNLGKMYHQVRLYPYEYILSNIYLSNIYLSI